MYRVPHAGKGRRVGKIHHAQFVGGHACVDGHGENIRTHYSVAGAGDGRAKQPARARFIAFY